MKVKKFNELIFESVRKLFTKIKEDTNNYLVYLLDDGYQFTFNDDLRWITIYMEHKNLSILKNNDYKDLLKTNTDIKWSDIKEDFLTYLEIMDTKYCFQFIEFSNYKKYVDKDDRSVGLTKALTKMLSIEDKTSYLEELENIEEFYFSLVKITFNKRYKK